MFTLDNKSGSCFGDKPQYFLGRIAKVSGNIHSYHMWIALNVAGILTALVSLYVCYFHFDIFHYNLCHLYARFGHADAQHIVGERLLHGRGVDKNPVNIYCSIVQLNGLYKQTIMFIALCIMACLVLVHLR